MKQSSKITARSLGCIISITGGFKLQSGRSVRQPAESPIRFSAWQAMRLLYNARFIFAEYCGWALRLPAAVSMRKKKRRSRSTAAFESWDYRCDSALQGVIYI